MKVFKKATFQSGFPFIGLSILFFGVTYIYSYLNNKTIDYFPEFPNGFMYTKNSDDPIKENETCRSAKNFETYHFFEICKKNKNVFMCNGGAESYKAFWFETIDECESALKGER